MAGRSEHRGDEARWEGRIHLAIAYRDHPTTLQRLEDPDLVRFLNATGERLVDRHPSGAL